MSIFRKRKLSLGEILKGLEALSEYEREQVQKELDYLNSPDVDEDEEGEIVEEVEETTETEPEEPVEPTEEVVEEPNEVEEVVETEEQVEEQPVEAVEEPTSEETTEIEEVSEPVQNEPINETQGEELADELIDEQADKELNEAQSAKIQALEAEVSELKEMLNKVLEREQNADFGLVQGVTPEKESEDDERYSAVIRGYAGSNARNYY